MTLSAGASMSSLETTQTSTHPPAQPAYIFRGHSAQVHSVHFLRQNLRLLTGDADGWVVLWSLTTRRPVAVWKPHTATVLGLGDWQDDRIITHGRDNKLHVWQLRPEDEGDLLSTILPVEDSSTENRKQPWLLHTLDVNALNFCSFAMCSVPHPAQSSPSAPPEENSEIIVATPGVQDGTVALTLLPSETRHSTVPVPRDVKTGMLMAVGVQFIKKDQKLPNLTVLAGYESGHAALWRRNSSDRWETVFITKQHTQPVLSLAAAPDSGWWYTSSADAIIARYPLHPLPDRASSEVVTIQTRHAGQQGLQIRSDEKIFATAGWDGRVRVYACGGMRELAVLKWHREGCYGIGFAKVEETPVKSNGREIDDDAEKSIRPLTVAEQRSARTKATHWLAAGSKDGKVSLWDIY